MLSILLIGVSLSMDAFAIAVTNGLTLKNFNVRHGLWMGLYFGGFQCLMPLIGCLLGSTVSQYIATLGPYISFALLAFIGGKMLLDSLKSGDGDGDGMLTLSHKRLLAMAVATSIDALAVGISLAMAGDVNILQAVILIGICTCLLSMAGVRIGSIFGSRFEKKAQLAGGVILILLGVKILLEHLGLLP